MSEDGDRRLQAARSWDAYWRLAPQAPALSVGGGQDAALSRFWAGVFARGGAGRPARSVLDFACGNGAVTGFAIEAGGDAGGGPSLFGADGAPAAIEAFRTRFPGAGAIVAEARRMPFADGAFDIVASQFGIEYAGIGAIEEAARLVAPGGVLAAVLHSRDGAIFRECEHSLQAMERVRASDILAAATEVFRRGAAAVRGRGSQAQFRRAEAKFAAAVTEVDAVLRDHGDAVAGGTVHRIYVDLAHMYGRLAAYDPAEVALWLDRMGGEITAYLGRMSAMVASAVDAEGLERAAGLAVSCGLSVRSKEALVADARDREASAAWVLVCDRP
ncbi:MAG: class I SAM-dependent methyltransferase [Burkholderiales bacterium]